MGSPFFSIIVPVYNTEKYLSACVDSLLRQGFTDFEVILVDDGSRDQSPAICDDYAGTDPRIRVIHKPNGGVSSARNTGIQAAAGTYVMFVDSDDFLLEGALETLHGYLRETRYDILNFGFRKELRENGETTDCVYPERESLEVTQDDLIRVAFAAMIGEKKNFLIEACSQAFRREWLICNGVCFDEAMYKAEDQIFTLRAYACAQRIKIVPDALYFYRYNPGSCMNTLQYSERSIHNSLRFLRNVQDVLSGKGIDISAYAGFFAKSLTRVAINPCIAAARDPGMKAGTRRGYIKELFRWYSQAAAENRIAPIFAGGIVTKIEVIMIRYKLYTCIGLYAKLLALYERLRAGNAA